jgi:hypothetical protein
MAETRDEGSEQILKEVLLVQVVQGAHRNRAQGRNPHCYSS